MRLLQMQIIGIMPLPKKDTTFKAINIKGESPSVYDGSGHGTEGRQKPIGLGRDVLSALQRADVGTGFVAGIGIVILAIIIDRLTQGANRKKN